MTTETHKPVEVTQADSPEAIWLSPICDLDAHHGEGRTWASPAPDAECEDCGHPWVKYVRSDLSTVSGEAELAVSGNGRILTRSDIEAVIDGLETNAVEHFEDAVRLLRYMADDLAASTVSEADGLAKIGRVRNILRSHGVCVNNEAVATEILAALSAQPAGDATDALSPSPDAEGEG